MSRRIAEGVGTVWVRPEKGGIEMVPFAEGDEVPDWAAKQMGDHCFTGVGDDDQVGDQQVPYSKWKKDDLQAEVARRNEGREDADLIEVEAPGNKPELVAALEADDAE